MATTVALKPLPLTWDGMSCQDHHSSHCVNKGHHSSRTLPFSLQSDTAAEPAPVTRMHPKVNMTGGVTVQWSKAQLLVLDNFVSKTSPTAEEPCVLI